MMNSGRKPFTVVGLDLSMTCTGVAHANGCQRVKSRGSKSDTLAQRSKRLATLCGDVMAAVTSQGKPTLVVVEAPSYGSMGGSTTDLNGFWWMVVASLHNLGLAVAEVAPTTLKKYATGRGNASKDEVLAAVLKRFPNVMDNNEADAMVLCAMGYDQFSTPLVDLPASNRSSLQSVKWPALP